MRLRLAATAAAAVLLAGCPTEPVEEPPDRVEDPDPDPTEPEEVP
jgi:hypothetical protein